MCNSNLNNVKHIRQIKNTRAFSPITRNFLAQKLMTSSHVFSSDLETIFTPTSHPCPPLVLEPPPPYSFPFSRHAKMRREKKSLWNEELSFFPIRSLEGRLNSQSVFESPRESVFVSTAAFFLCATKNFWRRKEVHPPNRCYRIKTAIKEV